MIPCCLHHSRTDRPLLRHSLIAEAHSCNCAWCFNSIDVSARPPVQNSAGTFRYVPALLSHTCLSACSFDAYESPIRTERKTIHLPPDTIQALNKLAARNGTDFSKEVRRAIDEYLDLESTAENIDMISGVIRQELSGQIKGLGNRLAGLINRLTIISAAGYYANIAIIADLIDRDRYSSFEKIEAAARKEALAFANQKNADALRIFLDDEEMKKAIQAVQGGRRVNPDL